MSNKDNEKVLDTSVNSLSPDDTSLWPSVSSLVNEIKGNLSNLSNRYDILENDGVVRATMDMCARVSLIVLSNKRIGNAKYVHDDAVTSSSSDAVDGVDDKASSSKRNCKV